jgi:predicted transcriptional regulator
MKVLGQAIQTVTNELRDSVEAGKETGRVYASIFGEGGKTFKQTAAEVQRLKTAVNELTKGLSETAKTDKIKEALNVQDANQRMQQLKVTLDALFDSGNKEAITFANSLNIAATNAVQLKAAGKITSSELNKELATLNTTANRTAKGLGIDLADGADKGQVSLWKLGNTFDRVGVQGVGNTIRIVDALRGINPALVVAAVGVAGLVVAFVKLSQVAIQVADKIKDIYIEIVKGSVDTAKQFEIVERQFANIFKGNEHAAKATFDKKLELSAQFGVDLTGDFSKILLPEIGSIYQLERAAKIASTMIVAF